MSAADRELREIDAAGIDHRELQQAARGQRLDMGKARGGFVGQRADADAGRRDRGIDGHIDLGADALDDARIDLPVEGLRAAAVIGMHMNDAGAGPGAGDALGDDRLDRVGNTGLAAAAPRPVQRRLDPDLAHWPHTPVKPAQATIAVSSTRATLLSGVCACMLGIWPLGECLFRLATAH